MIPITLVVLTLLFAVQRFGTGGIGKAFGPVTLLWFVTLIALGLPHIVGNPHVLVALNPLYAVGFFAAQPLVAFIGLGAVVLVVTGGEALYADLGHFGKLPIRIAWYGLVMPALVINYFGQGAMLLDDPAAVVNPFYLMAPKWAVLPLVVLATAATVIASQALITAAFSVTKQAVQLGMLPRMRIHHTSVRDTGQIYLPLVNWGLYVFIVLAVVLFRSSSNLASAYGIAVTLDMTITTVMTFFVIRYGWKYPLWLCLAATGIFFVIDVAFFASNMLKLFAGGWFPIVIGIGMFTLMLTWMNGRKLVSDRLQAEAIDLAGFLEAVFVSPPTRVSGTAVFLAAEEGLTPNALMHNLKHNKVLHEYNLFVTVKHHEVPWIGFDKRVQMTPLGHDCWQVTLHFGFKNDPDVPEALKLLEGRGVPLDEMDTSYFLSRDIVIPTLGDGMAMWREKLFASMHRNAAAAADFLNLPANRIVELGSKVEICSEARPRPASRFRGCSMLRADAADCWQTTPVVCRDAVGRRGRLRRRARRLHQFGGHRLCRRAGAGRDAGADHLVDVGAGPGHGADVDRPVAVDPPAGADRLVHARRGAAGRQQRAGHGRGHRRLRRLRRC